MARAYHYQHHTMFSFVFAAHSQLCYTLSHTRGKLYFRTVGAADKTALRPVGQQVHTLQAYILSCTNCVTHIHEKSSVYQLAIIAARHKVEYLFAGCGNVEVSVQASNIYRFGEALPWVLTACHLLPSCILHAKRKRLPSSAWLLIVASRRLWRDWR